MDQSKQRLPYKFQNAFFSSIRISRVSKLPKELQIPVEINIAIPETKFPIAQIDIKVKSTQNDTVPFEFTIIGIFEYTGTAESFDPQQNVRYLTQFGFHNIWPYLNQMIRIITSQMGINPISINLPDDFPPLQLDDELTGEPVQGV